MRPHRFLVSFVALAGMAVGSASAAPIIFLGFDTQGPVQQYTPSGTFLGNFGQGGATGSALDGAGNVWTVAPAFGNNRIERYDAAGNPLNSFIATVNGQFIEDMAYGGGNTLFVGTFEGNIFRIDATTGATIGSPFAVPGGGFTGVAFDGTNIWATSGFGFDEIYKYDTSGNLLATIQTGFNDAGGLGYDLTTNTLWAGYFSFVRQFDLNGNLLSSFTAGTPFHDGLEIGEIQATPTQIPEPTTMAVFGGLMLLGGAYVRRRKLPV